MNQEIILKMSVEDVNMVLKGLGTLPLNEVQGLFWRIQENAKKQHDALKKIKEKKNEDAQNEVKEDQAQECSDT